MRTDTPCETISSRTGKVRKARFNPADQGFPRLPRGLVYAHTCHNKTCSNQDHLRATTNSVNVLDIDNPRTGNLSTCKNGHEMTVENTRFTKPSRTHTEQRVCRTCARENMRRYRAEGRTK